MLVNVEQILPTFTTAQKVQFEVTRKIKETQTRQSRDIKRARL